MKPLHCVIIVIASFILLISVNPIFVMEFSQNNMSGMSKIDPKILKVLDRGNTVGDSFHTLVDVILENQSYVSDIPKDI
ncbi:MAG: hypothetical protein KGI05_04195 [Thaumarchaeota archaeon]|nr:hypothetical protein [Nitrososphaerota archaeon]